MNLFHRWYCRTAPWRRKVERTLTQVLDGSEPLGDQVLELGPGPGLTTELLSARVPRLTAVEIDDGLARDLHRRLHGSNVSVLEGDGSDLPFAPQCFTGVLSLTMLHHIRSPALQDRLFAEVFRVLRPGGVFAGRDSVWSPFLQLIHVFDTMVLVDPVTLPGRLARVGFGDVVVAEVDGGFRFRARRPVGKRE